jgi:hypothetical protein
MSKTFCHRGPALYVLSAGTPWWVSYVRWECRLESERSVIFLLEGCLERGINTAEEIGRFLAGRVDKPRTSLVQQVGVMEQGAL